jgi:hypothetical protein
VQELDHRDRELVVMDLEQLRLVLRERGEDETLVLDGLDYVTGWCSPQEAL